LKKTHFNVLGLLAITASLVLLTRSQLTATGTISTAFVFWLIVMGIFVRNVAEKHLGWNKVILYSAVATVITVVLREIFVRLIVPVLT
jgi:hypothetical protein